jgi:hypothetical protein
MGSQRDRGLTRGSGSRRITEGSGIEGSGDQGIEGSRDRGISGSRDLGIEGSRDRGIASGWDHRGIGD